MPDHSTPLQTERLALIRALWIELQEAREHTPQYEALMKRIRAATDAFRAALDKPE